MGPVRRTMFKIATNLTNVKAVTRFGTKNAEKKGPPPSCLSGGVKGLESSSFLEAPIGPPAEDNMIEERDPEEVAGFPEATGDGQVVLRRVGLPGGVVVDEDLRAKGKHRNRVRPQARREQRTLSRALASCDRASLLRPGMATWFVVLPSAHRPASVLQVQTHQPSKVSVALRRDFPPPRRVPRHRRRPGLPPGRRSRGAGRVLCSSRIRDCSNF